ncbi:MAG: hypothetical protein J6Y91_01795 [Alphaproteobacteria bacterium]|nr:hypothetical protein [Alphaproteobacteria bacterium]
MIEGLTEKLPKTLAHFNIFGEVGEVFDGPLITEIYFKLSAGSKFSNVEKMIKDIARELSVSGIRVSEVPNSPYISFEIPQPQAQTVPFAPLVYHAEFIKSTVALPICVGVNMRGNPVMKDLSKMPHLLVAGTTGSGKSVGLNSFILSLINKKKPEELQFVLIDPKRIEFGMYNNQQYMYRPVITDMNEASVCLEQLCNEMDFRYSLFEKNMVRNIGEYTEKGNPMPYIVCVIDEFSDLIMFDKNVEKQVLRLAQKARAAGIHLVIATQRPSVDVITGVIKANLPTRLSYKVASPTDSMTILNTTGAESLLGRGDSLLLEENGTLTRILGAYVSNDDIMTALEPYRCAAKKQFTTLMQEKREQYHPVPAPAPEPAPQPAEKKKPGMFARFCNFWYSLNKSTRTKIVNTMVAIAAACFAKSKTSATTSLKNTAKKTAKKIFIDTLTKKTRR